MRSFISQYKHFLLLVLVFVISEFIVNPIGDFPLNDDWCYGKAVYFSMTGNYTIGEFGAMTLFTHLMWGMLFVKIFGFSFTILRLSTLISVIISVFFLEKLVFTVTKSKTAAFIACLVLIFNPLYFNLSNTYMTDVNFNTLLILSCYFAFRFFESQGIMNVIFFFIFCILLVLIRQFGIILPACFIFACLFLKERKWFWFTVSIIGAGFVYLSLHTYENYLKEILPKGSAYKFSGGVHLLDNEFWKIFAYNFDQRYKILILHLCIYLAPICAFYLLAFIKSFKIYITSSIVILNCCFVWWFFREVKFPFYNILENMWLGPETFYESQNGSVSHTNSESFGIGLLAAKYFFTSVTFVTISFYILSLLKTIKSSTRFVVKPEIILLSGFMFSYIFMIFITESYFDRYFIPLITTGLILISLINKNYASNYKLALLFLLPFFYVAIFGTKDYLTWNRARWQAYDYLKETKKITADQVNGGFEINCWNDRKGNWWYNYTTLEPFDYLIQFRKEEGFRLLKEFKYQRYFPYTEDKINVFEKEVKK